MPDRFNPQGPPGRGRPNLIVHIFVDCIDTLHRTWPRRGSRQQAAQRAAEEREPEPPSR